MNNTFESFQPYAIGADVLALSMFVMSEQPLPDSELAEFHPSLREAVSNLRDSRP
jgi:hypothetical protein